MYMGQSNANKVLVQARANYCGEQVDIIDVVTDSVGKIHYMINYGGPRWVDASWLTNITWLV